MDSWLTPVIIKNAVEIKDANIKRICLPLLEELI